MPLEYNKELISKAKELRKEMTPQERRLWYMFLRKHELRFQRQKVIGNYIVDFYCHSARLVIEIDGSQHYSAKSMNYDEQRKTSLESQGLHTVRIANNDVNERFETVCNHIDNIVKELMQNQRS